MDWHLLDPTKSSIQTATAAGSFVALLITRKYGWVHGLILFIVGQVTAYFWTLPLAEAFHWDMTYYGPLGFSIGALAMLVWGAIIAFAQGLMNDPTGILARLLKAWRGGP